MRANGDSTSRPRKSPPEKNDLSLREQGGEKAKGKKERPDPKRELNLQEPHFLKKMQMS